MRRATRNVGHTIHGCLADRWRRKGWLSTSVPLAVPDYGHNVTCCLILPRPQLLLTATPSQPRQKCALQLWPKRNRSFFRLAFVSYFLIATRKVANRASNDSVCILIQQESATYVLTVLRQPLFPYDLEKKY